MDANAWEPESIRAWERPHPSQGPRRVSMLEGATEYLRHHTYRADEVRGAQAGCAECLLAHRMFRSVRTGEVIKDEFTRLHYPARWYYDILRGLDSLADTGRTEFISDPRATEALDILESRRRPDGSWAANRGYPGQTHAPMIRAGQPNPWVSRAAVRVLAAYGRA